MRLTNKRGDGFYEDTDECIVTNCSNKLGKLEDIEEEIGVDLETLFKALKNGAYFKRGRTIVFCRFDLTDLDTEIKRVNIFNTKKWEWEHYPFNCYGKTWALTKEELENE